MKESEFIAILSHELGDTAGWEDIVRDYAAHFEDGRAEGRSEDEIAASLGSPASIAREFRASGRAAASGAEGSLCPDGTWGAEDRSRPENASSGTSGHESQSGRRKLAIGITAAILVVGTSLGIWAAAREAAARRATEEGIHVSLPGMEVHVGSEGVRTDLPGMKVRVGGSGGVSVSGPGDGYEALFGETRPTAPIDLEKESPLAGVSSLSVSAYVADLSVKRRPGSEKLSARLSGRVAEAYAKEVELGLERKGSELRIEMLSPTGFDLRGSTEKLSLELELPESFEAAVVLETVTGSIAFSGRAKAIEARSETGEVGISSSSAFPVKVRTSTGEIAVSGTTGGAELESETGDILFTPTRLAETRLRTSTGDIRAELAQGQSFSYRVSSSTGELDVRGERPKDHDSSLSGQTGSGGPSISAESETGDIVID
jgi:hypothetical protein